MSLHPHARFLEDFLEGDVIESPARTITETDIQAFAGLSGDYNPLHCDAEYASTTPFGSRIAHGILGLSIATGLLDHLGTIHGTVIGFLGIDWKFTGPILVGDTIRVRATITSARRSSSKPDRGPVAMEAEVLNQRGETVQKGTWSFMMRAREVAAVTAGR